MYISELDTAIYIELLLLYLQDLFSPNLRAQASAVYIAVMTLAGGGLGPLLVCNFHFPSFIEVQRQSISLLFWQNLYIFSALQHA